MTGVETRRDCEEDPRNQWVNQKYNFDNLGQALMALFVLSSKDGWVNIMYTGLDAVGVDKQVSGGNRLGPFISRGSSGVRDCCGSYFIEEGNAAGEGEFLRYAFTSF